MVSFNLDGAQQGFGTVKLSGGAGQTDALLKTLVEAACVAQQPTALGADGLLLPIITGWTVYLVAATTFYWDNNNTVADATKMPLLVGDDIPIKKNNRALLGTIRVVIAGVYDVRVMLW